MQLISWTVARLGSRFSLLFEPHLRQVRHSALGRFLDEPLDLAVGLVEPDGSERVLPFTRQGDLLYNPEQFERFNSITYRAYSEHYRLRFEFNIHSLFYPQNERLCVMPAFYLEMRVNPMAQVRWTRPVAETPRSVKLFLRLSRPGTTITAEKQPQGAGVISLSYRNGLTPHSQGPQGSRQLPDDGRYAQVQERIVSLNPGAEPEPEGNGLSLELPVTDVGSGTKWRLVWAAHTADPVLQFDRQSQSCTAKFRYTRHWASVEEVLCDAIATRDDGLALSRRLEKAIEQTPLRQAQRHLLNQSFQNYLANTFWCDLENPTAGLPAEWFSVWEGSRYYHATPDVEYHVSPFYLNLWPQLLAKQLEQWPLFFKTHAPSRGVYLHHDLGQGTRLGTQALAHDLPVEENSSYLLMLQAYAHITGRTELVQSLAPFIEKLANYLVWADRDDSGFAGEGGASMYDQAPQDGAFPRRFTYLTIKRLAAIRAAAGLLASVGRKDRATQLQRHIEQSIPRVEQAAWLGDHYAVSVETASHGVMDAWSAEPLPFEMVQGWDGYCIDTGNGLLLPLMCGQSPMLDRGRLVADMLNASRETQGPYGSGRTSLEPEEIRISQNLWRDHLARYLGLHKPMFSQDYWDLQAMSNTGSMSLGFAESYIQDNLSFHPSGVTSMGIFFAGPRLVIDRLAPGGTHVAVSPDAQFPQRWPLMALADWKAGKIPVCVVNQLGKVSIENEIDPITLQTPGGSTSGSSNY